MSTATGIGHVNLNRKMGSYTTALVPSVGDLTQTYDREGDNPTCYPDFEAAGAEKPLLNFIVISSRVAQGTTVPDQVKWYFNGMQISFGADGISTGALEGYFEMVTPSSANNYRYPGLRVLKNLVKVGAYAPITIRVEGRVILGNDSDTLQASYTIDISQDTGGVKNVVKVGAVNPAQGFTIVDKNGSVQIKAVSYREGRTLVDPASLTHKWFRLEGGDWVEITSLGGPEAMSGPGNSVLTVHEGDVLVQGLYKCEVYEDGAYFGQDTEKVVDASDCYEIQFFYTPAHATISDDPDGCHSVEVQVAVIARKTQVVIVSKEKARATFTVLDAAGNRLNESECITIKNSQAVTLDMISQSDTGVDVAVQVEIPSAA